jgi:hypothetical protein
MNVNKLIDSIFIYSSLVFNISVSALYIATKVGNMVLVQVFGGIVVSLIVPFTITLLGYFREKAKKRTIISNGIIFIYLFLELLLDYVFKIPFREILAIHVPYIIVFYASLFSMLAVTFEKDKKMGYLLVGTFLTLIACLVYYLLHF